MPLDFDQFVSLLRSAAAEIRANHALLSQLDSFGGDGDHGTTMLRAMSCLEKAIDSCSARSIQTLLHEVGWAIMGVDGGATGPLLGTFFMSMAEPAAGKQQLNESELASLFEAGLAGVQRQTKARPGDKTMMDALIPAVAALRQSADARNALPVVLQDAAAAARAGAAATAQLQARFGRAKNLGPKSIGHADAGATSIALIFKGFADAL